MTKYGSNLGQPRLRKAVSSILQEECHVPYDPETEIIITSSGAEAINNALLAFIDPGDEVIIPSPAFVNYENLVTLCGGKAVTVPLTIENGFMIDPCEVEKKITDKTKMIVT